MGLHSPALFTLFLLCAPAFASGNSLLDQLRSQYVGKIVTLRHFYAGNHLRFRSDGVLEGDAETGPWTVDGQLSVEHIELHHDLLQFKGRRVYLYYYSKTDRFEDYLTVLRDLNRPDRKVIEKFLRGLTVNVEIRVNSDPPETQQISSALNSVFFAPGEKLFDAVPEYWRWYFAKNEGLLEPFYNRAETVYDIKSPEVTHPHVITHPNPEFTEEARNLKADGSVEISCVIDRDGNPTEMEVTKPAGLGLDDKAVATVRTWKFEPGRKGSEPIAFKSTIDVTFHIF